jgi:hypothetical protein
LSSGNAGVISGMVTKNESYVGTVESIQPVVIDGNTVFYVKMLGTERYYTVNPVTLPEVVFTKPSDDVNIEATIITERAGNATHFDNTKLNLNP